MSVGELVVRKFEDSMWDLLQEKPINRITVDEIVAKSGFSKRTFYNHFRDKNDLVASIWKREYRSCWFDDNGKPLTVREFLIKYHTHECAIRQFLCHTLPYSGQNNLWETVQETSIDCVIEFMRRNGYQDQIDESLRKSIEFYVHGINGLARSEFEQTSIKHLREYKISPEKRADVEISFIPRELRPYLLGEQNDSTR